MGSHNTTYLKALYRGYTDHTFTQMTVQPSWQGTQGPTLRSEVGDMVEIMFVNKLSPNYATMHSMGLSYNKMSEGAAYPPIASVVGTGECTVYKWLANDGAGPNDNSPARIGPHLLLDLEQHANGALGTFLSLLRGPQRRFLLRTHRSSDRIRIRTGERDHAKV